MKKRLDTLVLEHGFAASRERAKSLIMAGKILVDEFVADKPGDFFFEDCRIRLKGEPHKYVGRGGLKLEKALKFFKINLANRTALDIGCSTGGFTDCMLQNGVKEVIAVDVGYGQIDWKLRNDKRVRLLEKTNARYLTKDQILDTCIDFVVMDVSFISITKIVPTIAKIIPLGCELVCLIKPQFEAGRGAVPRNGVVKDKLLHQKILTECLESLTQLNFKILGLTYSPFKGADGNIEYLVYSKFGKEEITYALTGLENEDFFDIISGIGIVVQKAHELLNAKA